MGRAFIEFIQSQDLAWKAGLPADQSVDGIDSKLLSQDDETGACTVLIRYSPGAGMTLTGSLGHDEAFFVLQGELVLDDVHYRHLSYAHLPADYRVKSRRASPRGSIVLGFFSAEPSYGSRTGDPDHDRLVRHVSAYTGTWEALRKDGMPPGARRLGLFDDPHSGEQTWLLGAAPIRSATRAHRHDVVEEMFLVEGSEVTPLGRMEAGGYFWRPPGVFHGPFGTPLPGKLELFRSVGGPLQTEYFEEEVEFDWAPGHATILPPLLGDAQLHKARMRIERADY